MKIMCIEIACPISYSFKSITCFLIILIALSSVPQATAFKLVSLLPISHSYQLKSIFQTAERVIFLKAYSQNLPMSFSFTQNKLEPKINVLLNYTLVALPYFNSSNTPASFPTVFTFVSTWYSFPPNVHRTASFSSFRSLLKCHLSKQLLLTPVSKTAPSQPLPNKQYSHFL